MSDRFSFRRSRLNDFDTPASDEERTRRRLALLARALGLTLVAAAAVGCVEGPPFAEESAITQLELAAGETATLVHRVEVESLGGGRDEFDVILRHPASGELARLGIETERSWHSDGESTNADWPSRLEVANRNTFIGWFTLELTNTTAEQVDLEIEVSVRGRGGVGNEGSAERIRVEITLE